MNVKSIFQKNSRVIFIAAATFLLVVIGLVSVSFAGARGAASCDGTYLVVIGQGESQTEALWTFSKDGTFQGTDSAQIAFNFSHQQGVWTHTGANKAKATWLDFNFATSPEPKPDSYARVDAELAFDHGCDTLSGTLDLRFYALGQDPLDPKGGSYINQDVPFTGRRLNP